MTGPGADSTNGIACAVVLPDRGAMNATTVSSHDAYTAGPRRPPGRISCPRASPASAGSIDRGIGAGQGPAQPGGGAGDGQPGQRPHPRVAGQRRDRIPRASRHAPSSRTATTASTAASAASSRTAVTATADGRGVRPRVRRAPVQQVTGEFHPERFPVAACDRPGDRAAAQISAASAASDQQAISTAQPAAVPPGASRRAAAPAPGSPRASERAPGP